MRIKKRFLALLSLVVVLVALMGGAVYFVVRINTLWNDKSTWTTESKVILPQETSMLKVSYEEKDTGISNRKTFNFVAEYCYLYEITYTDTEAVLKCSLLPMYYAENKDEVSGGWREKSDILIKINKDTDVEPTSFLGRIDRSFRSVKSLGSTIYPVTVKISGDIQYPEDTVKNRLQHFVFVTEGKKEQLSVSISAYSVDRLDEVSPATKIAFAEQKISSLRNELEKNIDIDYQKLGGAQQILSAYKEKLKFYRYGCSTLSTCSLTYQNNPADLFAYYLYSLRTVDTKKYQTLFTALKEIYPFKDFPEQSNTNEANTESRWLIFNPSMFSICPINDVIKGKTTENADLLNALVLGNLREKMPKNDSEVLTLLNRYSPVSYEKEGMWELEIVEDMNLACHYVLNNKSQNTKEVGEKLVQNYFSMLSTMLGKKVEPNKESYANIIYLSNAFSPYKSNYVLDYAVMNDRNTFIETTKSASERYAEWRSLWNSLILLYLYEK